MENANNADIITAILKGKKPIKTMKWSVPTDPLSPTSEERFSAKKYDIGYTGSPLTLSDLLKIMG